MDTIALSFQTEASILLIQYAFLCLVLSEISIYLGPKIMNRDMSLTLPGNKKPPEDVIEQFTETLFRVTEEEKEIRAFRKSLGDSEYLQRLERKLLREEPEIAIFIIEFAKDVNKKTSKLSPFQDAVIYYSKTLKQSVKALKASGASSEDIKSMLLFSDKPPALHLVR